MIRKLDSPAGFHAFGAFLAAIGVAAFAAAGHVATGLVIGGIVLAYVVLVVLGRRRSPTLESLSGIGDERTTGITLRAAAIAGSVLVSVILVWWLVSVAGGHQNTTLSTLAGVFGAAFILACAVLQRRS